MNNYKFIWFDDKYCYEHDNKNLHHDLWCLFEDSDSALDFIICNDNKRDIICSCALNDNAVRYLEQFENLGIDITLHFHWNNRCPFKNKDANDLRTIIERNGWTVITNEKLIELLEEK